MRTNKLLKCISTCDYVISKKWLIDSKQQGKFIDLTCSSNYEKYQVKNEQFEASFNFVLSESLKRARENRCLRQQQQHEEHSAEANGSSGRGLLLNGLVFYLSPSVRPSYKDLEEMIQSANGQIMQNLPTLSQLQEPCKDERNTVSYSFWIVSRYFTII